MAPPFGYRYMLRSRRESRALRLTSASDYSHIQPVTPRLCHPVEENIQHSVDEVNFTRANQDRVSIRPVWPIESCEKVVFRMPAEPESESSPNETRDSDGSPQQFCLRWNNYQTNLTNCFDHLLQAQLFVDVSLSCEGQTLKAHKVVLSACSPYFQSLFIDNPHPHPIIIIKDIKYCDLKAVVDFMYRGEINVCQEQITALLKVAETLKVRGLTDVSGETAGAGAVIRPETRPSKRAASGDRETPPRARMRVSSPEPSPLRSPSTPAASAEPAAATGSPAAAPAAPLHTDDVDIRPGIAEMIREEERARMIESSNPWLGASTSSIAADSYQYQLQSMWQKCWNNTNLVHNLRFRERGPLKSWRPETMAEAIFSVLKEGLSLSQAARKYDIPYPTFVLYANRVHNMLGPSADGGADLRPKGRGRPQRILLGVWPDEHIRGVIRAVVFRDTHAPHATHHMKEDVLPPYPAITDGMGMQPSSHACGNGRDGGVSPNAAAAAAVAAVAHGLRRQMCNMVVAAQRPPDHVAHMAMPPLPMASPRLPSPLSSGLESPLCSPPPPGHALEPPKPTDPYRPYTSPRPDSRFSNEHVHADQEVTEMGPPKTPVASKNGKEPLQATVPVKTEPPPARPENI